MDKLFTEINDYVFVCKKCKTTSFRLHPDGSVQCEDCNTIYIFNDFTQEWTRTVKSLKTRKKEYHLKNKSKNKDDKKDDPNDGASV